MGRRAIEAKLRELAWALFMHRKRLMILLSQQAHLGDRSPPELIAEIEQEKESIANLEADITHWRSKLSGAMGLPGAMEPKIARVDKAKERTAQENGALLDGSSDRVWLPEIEHKMDSEKPRTHESRLEAYGIARLLGNEPNRPLLLTHSYTLEAGISLRPLKGFRGTRIKIPRREDSMVFDIAITSAGIEISPTWLQSMRFEPAGKGQVIAQFTLVPREVGPRQIRVEFYYQRHWLSMIQFEVEVVEAQELVPA